MRCDGIVNDRQPEAGSILFGAEERVEDSRKDLLRNAASSIGDRHCDFVGSPDMEFAASRHCFYCVQNQIEENLSQKILVTPDLFGERLSRFDPADPILLN